MRNGLGSFRYAPDKVSFMHSRPRRPWAAFSYTTGMLQHLKFVMRSKSVDVQREAVRGVANISAEYAYTAVIAGAGAIMPLVAMLSSPDFLCQR